MAGVEKAFQRAMEAAPHVFGRIAFRKYSTPQETRRPINRGLFETEAVVLARCTETELGTLATRSHEVTELFGKKFFEDQEFSNSLLYATGKGWASNKRLEVIDKILRRCSMLEGIKLINFKAARDLDLPLASLTLFAGLNGSGKSTILQSLAALRQSYQVSQGRALQLGGPLVPLGQGKDVLSEGAEEKITLTVRESGTKFQWVCKVVLDANQLEFTESPSTVPQFALAPHFQYLQADRIAPRTLYPQANEQARQGKFLGVHGEFTADFLARNPEDPISLKRHASKEGAELDDILWAKVAPTHHLLDQVAGWLQQISPGARLRAEPLSQTDEVILQFQYVGQELGFESGYYRPTHVGFGLTYCLPIIVACLAAPAGALLLIENPEAHLHPHGQVKLGELLAICAADGVQILVETHSDHVLNGIRLAVKKGSLIADNVRLCYFTRDVTRGDCYVELPSVLPNGQLSNWPAGFFDQWELSLNALLD